MISHLYQMECNTHHLLDNLEGDMLHELPREITRAKKSHHKCKEDNARISKQSTTERTTAEE